MLGASKSKNMLGSPNPNTFLLPSVPHPLFQAPVEFQPTAVTAQVVITLASLDHQQKVSWWFWFMKMPLMIADCYDDKYANVAITTVS